MESMEATENSLRYLFQKPVTNVADENETTIFTGKNTKQILLIANEVDDDAKDFLKRVIENGLKIPFDETALVNFSQQHFSFAKLVGELKPKYVFCFGLKPADLKMNIEIVPYQALHFHGCEVVFSSSVKDVAKSEQLKKVFWDAMKKMFKLN